MAVHRLLLGADSNKEGAKALAVCDLSMVLL